MPCGRFGGACAPFAPPLGPALRIYVFVTYRMRAMSPKSNWLVVMSQ